MRDDLLLINHLIELIDEPVLITSTNLQVLSANTVYTNLLGLQEATVSGTVAEFYEATEEQLINDKITGECRANKLWRGAVRLKHSAGQFIAFAASASTFKQTGSALLVISFNATASTAHQALGSVDESRHPVTGLNQEFVLADRIRQGIKMAPRNGKTLAVLLVSVSLVDQDNQIIEGVGDKVLYDIGKRLKSCIRSSDTLTHYPNVQFAMVLQITGTDDTNIVVKKIFNALSSPITDNDQTLTARTHIGISLSPIDAREVGQLLSFAEDALTRAKAENVDSYEYYAEEFNTRARYRNDLENKLQHAIKNKEFILYYQPKVRAGDNRIVGLEGLIRWVNPELGMVSPGEFIPLSEETGLINQIGLWVIEEGCRQNMAWINQGISPIKLSVNVSSRQLHADDFVENVKQALEKNGLSPAYLELEITESMLVTKVEETISKLEQIREIGCHLSIDDFGTGYSSLSYLTRFPLNTLKIDRAFVKDLENSNETAEVAKAIIGLSKSLNLEVVAEGAESMFHVDFLKQHGCDSVQGYYYSKPLPADEIEKLLRKGYITGKDYD